MPVPAPALIAGRYAVREVLAVGGMSTVHLAEDLQLGRQVALKVFRTSGDPLAADRLRREGELLARLEHPDLVRAFDAGADEDGSNAWVALELVTGPNVAVALHAGGPLSPAEGRRLLEHISAALAYIHGLGIVHRDVKPSNVLLTADPRADPAWRAKLADFGIAMQLDPERVLVGDFPVGTAAYFSPEQTLGQPVTTASDIYSLGLVLLEALTGERAFPGGAVESATARLFRQPTLPGWLDDGWRGLLETMTAREPRSRPTAAQVRAACRSLQTELVSAPAASPVGALHHAEMRTEPATLFVSALPPAPGSVAGPPVPVRDSAPRRRRLGLHPGFADRFSRRALVLASAGVLVLGTAAGGSALVAAAPATPIIPLEEALPTAPAVAPVVTPKPVPEQAATATPAAAPARTAPVGAPAAVERPTPAHGAASTTRGAAKHAAVKHAAVKHVTARHAATRHAAAAAKHVTSRSDRPTKKARDVRAHAAKKAHAAEKSHAAKKTHPSHGGGKRH